MLGHQPQRREPAFLRRIALVAGNRSSIAWDLPALDSYLLLKALYGIPNADFVHRRDQYIELLELGDIVSKPVRNLSLGERMKVELVGSLLHAPEVLFLDEPTLGLDVTMQRRLRTFVRDYNQEYGATVLLTSHYMADVVELCERVLVIHRGRIHYDGGLSGLTSRFASPKTITVVGAGLPIDLDSDHQRLRRRGRRASIGSDQSPGAARSGRCCGQLSAGSGDGRGSQYRGSADRRPDRPSLRRSRRKIPRCLRRSDGPRSLLPGRSQEWSRQ